MSHEFTSSLAGRFWVGIFNEVAVKMSAVLQSSEGLNGLKNPLPRYLTVMAIGRRVSYLLALARDLSSLPCGPLHRTACVSSQWGSWLASE